MIFDKLFGTGLTQVYGNRKSSKDVREAMKPQTKEDNTSNKSFSTNKFESQEELALHILDKIKSLDSSEKLLFELDSVPGYRYEVIKKRINS